jgi:3D (Asp-Asp-Asp) domain-containing protein
VKNLYRAFAIFVIAALFLLALYAILFLHLSLLHQNETIRHNTDRVIQQQAEDRQTLERLKLQKQELQERLDAVLEIFGRVIVDEFEVTAYAPLSPDAVEGVCFEGNPNVTASGGRPVPGETAAAGPSVPFGTRVISQHFDVVVNDRGGMIGDRSLDIVMASRSEAFSWGRRNVKVMVIPPEVLPP